MTNNPIIPICFGDGVGHEIMYHTLNILRFADVPLSFHTLEMGSRSYHHGFRYGIPASAMDKIMEHKILLTAPIASKPNEEHFLDFDIASYLNCEIKTPSNFPYADFNFKNLEFMTASSFFSKADNDGNIYAIFKPDHNIHEELAEDTVNPTAMILAAIMLLKYLDLNDKAEKIHNALYNSLKSGYLTFDIIEQNDLSNIACSTTEFVEQIIARL